MNNCASYVAELYRGVDEIVSRQPTAVEMVTAIARARADGCSLARILRNYLRIAEIELARDAARERATQ